MHLLRTDIRSLDDGVEAVELDQKPAEIVMLSFSDGDLAVAAAAWEEGKAELPSLRLAHLGALRHPYSVDRYIEQVAAKARFVLVRLLGGLDYWRYGAEELGRAARRDGFALAIVPGDGREDARLDAASTLPPDELRHVHAYLQNGGPENLRELLRFAAARAGRPLAWREPAPVAAFGVYRAAARRAGANAPKAAILLYRSALLAADTAPILALADALAERGASVSAAFVTSLKDELVAAPLAGWLATERPDVILNTTAFSARIEGGGVLDLADCPVLQAILAGASEEQWRAASRGLSAADLAMNVVLPEIDGRIIAGAISFKGADARSEALEFAAQAHRPEASRVAHVADLALAWARLRRLAPAGRRLALVLSDYPGKGGRAGYAVGLDTPASVIAIADALREVGYRVGALPRAAELMAALVGPSPGSDRMDIPAADRAGLTLPEYERLLTTLPPAFAASVAAAWGPAAGDPSLRDGTFSFNVLRSGNLTIALQPDRGLAPSRKSDYHDANLPPRHAYIAFYLWLRRTLRIDAMIHCGTHGTLEWLPGKAVALSEACAPEAVLGPVPAIYPFIVNNPGEAGQAKRRIGAVTVGHLTPPLIEAGSHGATAELEALFDEYADAQSLDARRARLLSQAILDKAGESGLAAEIGLDTQSAPDEALAKLDAWLCDLKEMRIGDGLHVFGREAPGEPAGLLRALDGRFLEPGPAGAPSRGRTDVLPTGRNLYTVDPRAVPTRTAWEIGSRTAADVMARHAQDHGEWPARIVIDLWGSASMRTGGDDIAQGLALMGVRPVWDDASTRVSGFEVLTLARLGRPRVDVTLRISGLFRDVFPAQIALFADAVAAVAALDEEPSDNPLAAAARASGQAAPPRIFGAAPGAFGIGIARRLSQDASAPREELGEAYMAATSHAYGGRAALEGVAAAQEFRGRVASADVFVHVQDMEGQDLLDADAFAEHEGGFAAAAETLGNAPVFYHADTSRPGRSTVRTLSEEMARVVRGRAANPRWIAGQMRHGFRGAAEIAETVDNLFVFAATSRAVESGHFDLLFDAVCGEEAVRAFLQRANPEAARAIARRFAEAQRRGFWLTRRNSSAAVLAEMMEPAS